MMDIVLSVTSKVAEYLVAPVGHQCCYVIYSDRYVRQLIAEDEKLRDTKDEVQHSIGEAENNMKPIKAKVEKWVKEVERVTNQVRDLLDYDGRVKKTCFCGWLPNPKACHRLGKEASRMIKDIQVLIAGGQFERVYYENPPPGLVGGGAPDVNSSAGDGGDTITDSRASFFQGIMKALDDEKLKVIGVYGPGGVGKTTLLEKVEKKLRKEGRPFHMIVKAKVSQTPDLKKIQDDIAYAFSLNLKDQPSEEGRRDLLFRKVQSDPTKKVLIILDDLWDKLDLKAVGIPSGDESKGCKLLLSSRYKDVLEQKMHAERTFRLEGLNYDEAFRLFEKTVGNKLKDEEELKPIAAQVVKKLAGLPLLITSVASTLKYSNVSAWRNALIKIEELNIKTIVKLSYDHLESEDAKSLFLLCGLIGGTIRVKILLVLGMGLGLFGGFNKTMQGARDRLSAMLDSLRSVCLLQDEGDDEENVTIHDLYSEVVVSTPFEGQISFTTHNNYGSWPKDKLEKCWACLVNVGSDRLAQLTRRGFPDMMILMVSEERDMANNDNLNFTCMKELRVLYLGSMHFNSLPSSIEILGSLQSLYLPGCDVEDVAILGKLKALQILSFAGSSISRLPKEIGELTNLRSLNLSNCFLLKIIEPSLLKGLINLEELLMQNSFDRWIGEDEVPLELCNARIVELRSLTKLTTLEISIPDPTVLLEAGDLPFGNLIRFWIKVGNFSMYWGFKVLRTMMLNLKGCESILSKEWVQKTLHKTQYLLLEGLEESKENARPLCNAHELCTQGFPQLKHLHIRESPSIEYIANSSGGIPLTAFTKLESLVLRNLINLEKICHGPVASESFNKLKDVEIRWCDRLKYVWSLSQMQTFVHLEDIKVWSCESMRAIVIDDAREDIIGDDIVELPNVRRLKLARLPKMRSICIGAGITSEGAPIQVSFRRLESPEMEGLFDPKNVLCSQPPLESNNLRGNKESATTTSDSQDGYSNSLFSGKVSLPSLEELELNSMESLKRIWHGELPRSSLCKLATFTLVNCFELVNVFPSTIIERLHNLKEVVVSSCTSLELLFDCGSLDSNTERTNALLPKLEKVRISEAGKLRCMVEGDSQNLRQIWQSGGLPSLRFIEVKRCPRLRMLFPTFTAKFLGQIKELVVESCEDTELIAGSEECEEATGMTITFSELTALRLFKLPKFKSFLPEKYSAEFPSLQFLSRVSCGTEPDQCLGDWESYSPRYLGYFHDPHTGFSDDTPSGCTIC